MKKVAEAALLCLLVMTVLAAGLVAGCGGTKTVIVEKTVPSSDTHSKPSSTSPDISPDSKTPASDSATLPRYQPSTVVSDAGGSLQLTSPDSVEKVTAFYDDALAQGWTVISSSKTGANTSITAKKGNVGTSLSISTTGSGCYISLVTYPI